MARENIYLTIEAITKGIGKIIWCTEKVSYIYPTEKYNTKENGQKMSQTVGEFIIHTKLRESHISGKNMRDSFVKDRWMGEENLFLPMMLFMKESLS